MIDPSRGGGYINTVYKLEIEMAWQPRSTAVKTTTIDYAELLIELARYEKEISGRLLRKEYAEARRAANDLRVVIEDLIDLLRDLQ